MKVKEFYKIGELSKLYDISVDSLRYYEDLGILKPKRAPNGYRMYNIGDINTLNILRELRLIGFSLKEIKNHLSSFNLESTISLFNKELDYIDKQIEKLNDLKTHLIKRIDDINIHKNYYKLEEPEVKFISTRKILKLSENVYRDEDLDFVLKKLQQKNEDQIYLVGNGDIGAIIPLENLITDAYGKFTSVFSITKNDQYDDYLSKGRYLSMVVKGGYDKMPKAWAKMLTYIKDYKLEAIGDAMELYIIDNHITDEVNEFVTELQIKIK